MALVPFPSKGAKSAPERDPDDWDDDDAPEESGGKMSFLDHLDELRRRLMWAVGSVVIGFGIAVAFYQQLFDFVMNPMQAMLPAGQKMIYTEPTEALMLYVKIAVIAGILIASPGVMTRPSLMRMLRAYTALTPGCLRKTSRNAGFVSIHARVAGSTPMSA